MCTNQFVSHSDAVLARPNQEDAGAIAEFARLKENELAIKPAGLSHTNAASVPLAGLTAWQALITKGNLKKGEKVLIHAGSGGVGTYAIQIAKHFGAYVATTTSAKNAEGTEEKNMVMKNGKQFSTRNHPIEMLVTMLHLKNAGFDIDIITPTGKPVQIEMWAMPEDDDAIKGIYQEYKHQFDNPGSVTDFVENSLIDDSPYISVYLPGGHGAMLGLPENPDVGEIIRWSHKQGQHMLAICHGPAALLAASIGVEFGKIAATCLLKEINRTN